jgi:uncharacterized protein YndB with AHSA1/START domain/ribosomal protein S18 acetylase RimI-like enzyme
MERTGPPVRPPAGRWLHLEEVVAASAGRTFEALVDPDELRRWWGPHGFTIPDIELDLAVDGRYRFVMQPPVGERFHLQGRFVEIDPPRRLRYTFRWEEPDPDDVETVVTLALVDLGAATRITVEQGAFATEARRALHERGWTDSLEKLALLLGPRPTERVPSTTREAPAHVRVAGDADAGLLAELGARTFRAAYAGDVAEASLTSHVEATFDPERQARELADPATCHLVAERDGRAVGYAYLTQLDDAVASLVRLYVDPAHAGSGVGRQLLDRCLEVAGRRGCSDLRLTVWTANTRAIAFYRRNGFVVAGRERFLLGEEEQTDLVMERGVPPAG